MPTTQDLIANCGPQIVENVRVVRTTLFEGLGGAGKSIVVVTSSQSRTGKTSVAILPAHSLAMLGNKTLLVESDLRRPSLAQRIDLETQVGLIALVNNMATESESIRATRTDILLVAMSSPKKEVFLEDWFSRLDVPVCHGAGGAFDVLAGKVRRTPDGWQRLGLEWLYRMDQEPHRLWRHYLVTNILFGMMVLRERFGWTPRL